jgi:hypothetical protein
VEDISLILRGSIFYFLFFLFLLFAAAAIAGGGEGGRKYANDAERTQWID